MATLEWSPLPRLGPHGLWVPLGPFGGSRCLYGEKSPSFHDTQSGVFERWGGGRCESLRRVEGFRSPIRQQPITQRRPNGRLVLLLQ